MKKKICVVNGKRGGFNALLPTMRAIDEDPAFELQVLLTDMHLSQKFGFTLDYAKRFIDISKTVPLNQTGDTALDRVQALSRGLAGIADAFFELRPDLVLLLGDRSETLVTAFAALQLKIPIAHIQGGEVSGNIDGIQRHAITKLAHLHFAETEKARQRILHLGEELWRVHRSGAPYIDFIKQKLYSSEQDVRKRFNLKTGEKFLLVLQHPVTTQPEKSYEHMNELLLGVLKIGLRTIIVYPCSDQGYEGIIDAIEARHKNPLVSIYRNIPAEDFIGLQAIAGALVGNSSAGIYEAPYLYCPFVNVGKRQTKRERENNCIDAPPEREAIYLAIQEALHDEKFREKMRQLNFLYGDGQAYKRIVGVLKKTPFDKRLFEKRLTYYSTRRRMYDLYLKKYIDFVLEFRKA